MTSKVTSKDKMWLDKLNWKISYLKEKGLYPPNTNRWDLAEEAYNELFASAIENKPVTSKNTYCVGCINEFKCESFCNGCDSNYSGFKQRTRTTEIEKDGDCENCMTKDCDYCAIEKGVVK